MKKSHIFWGLLLIIIGILWILPSTDWVSMDIIGAVRTLWPILLVAAGITLLLKKEAHVMRAVVWVLAIALIAGYAVYLGHGDYSVVEGSDVFELENGMEHAALTVDAGAANLRIGASDSALARVDSDINGLKHSFSAGRDSIIKYSQKWTPIGGKSGKNFSAELSKAVSWELEFNTGSTDGIIDFSDFPLERCEINTGACDLRIVAGDLQDESTIECNSGAASISITIPEGTGIRIESNAAVNDVNGNGVTLNKTGREYESSNFDSAEKVIFLYVNCGVSDITVNASER